MSDQEIAALMQTVRKISRSPADAIAKVRREQASKAGGTDEKPPRLLKMPPIPGGAASG